jgi:hypothetical protein
LTADKMRALGRQPTQKDLGSTSQSPKVDSKVMGTFRKEGEFWTVTYAGTTFRLKDAKGLHYIAYLLARPGQRFHVHDLIASVEGGTSNGRTAIHAESEGLSIVRDVGGAGSSLDARARSEYRTRLRDLHGELDEAERMNDLGRVERIRSEIDLVEQELSGSSGLGGRQRTASVSVERARGPVRKSIRSVIDKIREAHPSLGHHLATSISTGYFCGYHPGPDTRISWQF